MIVATLICALSINNVDTITFNESIVRYDVRIESIMLETETEASPYNQVVATVTTVSGEIVEFVIDGDERCTVAIKER